MPGLHPALLQEHFRGAPWGQLRDRAADLADDDVVDVVRP